MFKDAHQYLVAAGQKEDSEIDLFQSAMAYSFLEKNIKNINEYHNHFNGLVSSLNLKYEELSALENSDDVIIQAKSLAHVMAQENGYIGSDNNANDFQNTDMARVVDRREGMPITLCILAISLCRAVGWHADGLNFPGHFLMRLEKDGDRLMVDPFQACKILEAKDLRIIVKKVLGDDAELSSDFYDPCSNRDILLRLQNNYKYRFIDAEKYEEALDIVYQMAWIAPNDNRLNLDMAVLQARLERPKAAIKSLMLYIDNIDNADEKADAEKFLSDLRSMLH